MALLLPAIALLAAASTPQEPVRVQGRVVDLQGAPIEAVAVWAREPSGDWPATTAEVLTRALARTDGEGRYSFATTQYSSVQLWFAAPGYCALRYQHFVRTVPGVEPNVRVPTLALPPAVTVMGRVRDPGGDPIAGAIVTGRDLAPSEFFFSDVVTTDAKGIFRLTAVPASPLELRVEADGYSPARMLPIDRSSPLDVTLEAAVSCTGYLLDAGGQPMSCRVGLSYEDGASTWTEVEDDGVFRLTVRPGIRYRVRAHDDSRVLQCRSEILEGAVDGVELRMPGGRDDLHLELTVVAAETGAPIPEFHAAVNLRTRHAEDKGQSYHAYNPRTGSEGKLRLPVDTAWKEGEGVALVRAPGRAEVFVHLQRPEEGEKLARVRIEMPRERTISGTVVDADGKPVAGAKVWPFTLETRISSYSSIPRNFVATDADGRFRLGGLAAEDYAVNVSHDAFPLTAPVAVSLADGDVGDLSFTLARTNRLEIEWSNPPERGDWWIDLFPRQGRRARGADKLPRWSGTTGRVLAAVAFDRPLTIERAAADRFDVSLSRLTTGRLAQKLEVDLGEIVLDGSTKQTLDLSRLRAGEVRGRVTGSSLVGLDRLMVRARGESYRKGSTALPDRDGAFSLETLAGDYVVEVVDLVTGFAVGRTDPLRVVAGERVECEVVVEAGVLDVQIALPEGATRTAMWCLLLELPEDERRNVKQIRLADLRGDLRFVLPPGEMRIGFQRARGALGPTGSSKYVDVGMVPVEVVRGRVTAFTLQEPPRMSTEELADEDPR